MYQYLTVWTTGFSLSAMSARYWPFLPGKRWIVLTACIVIIIHIAIHRDVFNKHLVRLIKKNSRVANWYGQTAKLFTVVSFMISGIMSGMIWMASVGHWYLAWQLPESKIQQDVIVSGRITQTRDIGHDQQLILAVHQFGDRTVFPSPSLLLFVEKAIGRFQLHQHVTLSVKLKPVSGMLNPGGDKRSWYVSKAIVASGTVNASYANRITEPASSFHHFAAARSRQAGYSRWLVALLTGDRRGLQQADWQLMRETGTGHLFSISGLHVGMVALWASVLASAMYGVIFWLWGLPHNRCNVRGFTFIVVVLLTALYATLANWQVPVARAWLLVLMVTGLFFSRAVWSWLQRFILMIAACILLFPFGIFGSSFYLSAGALALLLFIGSRFSVTGENRLSKLKVLIVSQCVLSFLLLPVTVGFFDAASLLTAPVNLLAIPVVTVIVPLGMMGLVMNYFTLQPNWLLDVADFVMSMLVRGLTFVEPWMISVNQLNIQPMVAILTLCAMLLLLMPPFRFRWLCIVLFSMPLSLSFLKQNPAPWIVHVFDVGHGSAIAIARGERAVLIDSGPSFEQGNMLRTVVVPTLRHLNIKRVDHVIFTHGDDDHAGGRKDIGLLSQLSHEPVATDVRDNLNGCQRGDAWQWQNISFSVLWPRPGNTLDNNAQSCVLRISETGRSLLIAGDIPKSSEYDLLYLLEKETGMKVQSDLLIAPHHGSDTSSSRAFVNAVSPKVTVFTTGAFHRWQLPDEQVQARYLDVGSEVYDTGQHGYVRLTMTTGNVIAQPFNRAISPRWYDNRGQHQD
ncbi:DNA internalization-related competence protein ComEC/Rec2 [Alteromonas confluentis]|nr:DNA internalization-related competence protein ComEC/Rec2 [Alteromonas confluentis]